MYKGKKVIHIVARGFNGEIGANNKLLWSIPEDMKYFKESTIGHVILMKMLNLKADLLMQEVLGMETCLKPLYITLLKIKKETSGCRQKVKDYIN